MVYIVSKLPNLNAHSIWPKVFFFILEVNYDLLHFWIQQIYKTRDIPSENFWKIPQNNFNNNNNNFLQTTYEVRKNLISFLFFTVAELDTTTTLFFWAQITPRMLTALSKMINLHSKKNSSFSVYYLMCKFKVQQFHGIHNSEENCICTNNRALTKRFVKTHQCSQFLTRVLGHFLKTNRPIFL